MKNQRTPGLWSRRKEGRPLAIRKDACNQPNAGIRADDGGSRPQDRPGDRPIRMRFHRECSRMIRRRI